MGRLSFELDFERQMAKKGKWIRKLEEGWRDETAALTVGQGVALKPIQVLLMQHLGQDTAIDDVSAIHHQEAACHAHEQHLHGPPEEHSACQSLRAGDLERETIFVCSLDAQCLVSSSACPPQPQPHFTTRTYPGTQYTTRLASAILLPLIPEPWYHSKSYHTQLIFLFISYFWSQKIETQKERESNLMVLHIPIAHIQQLKFKTTLALSGLL